MKPVNKHLCWFTSSRVSYMYLSLQNATCKFRIFDCFIPIVITMHYCKIDLKTLKDSSAVSNFSNFFMITSFVPCLQQIVAFRHFDRFNTCFSIVIFCRSLWLLKGVSWWFHTKVAPHIPFIVWSHLYCSRQISVVLGYGRKWKKYEFHSMTRYWVEAKSVT